MMMLMEMRIALILIAQGRLAQVELLVVRLMVTVLLKMEEKEDVLIIFVRGVIVEVILIVILDIAVNWP
jgi:hypothetical protein